VTGAANDSAGHNNRCREQSALSKAGWSTILADSDTFVGEVPHFARRAENWNFATRHCIRRRTSLCFWRNRRRPRAHRLPALICYLQGRQAAGRAGCSAHPDREGLPIWGPEPFASSSGLALRSSREAPSWAAFRPAGASRQTRRRGESAAAGRRKGSTPPRSWSTDASNSLRKCA
jgi:hypothetical protein